MMKSNSSTLSEQAMREIEERVARTVWPHLGRDAALAKYRAAMRRIAAAEPVQLSLVCNDCGSGNVRKVNFSSSGTAPTAQQTDRNAVLEEVAKWHDREAAGYLNNARITNDMAYMKHEAFHRNSAIKVRSMKSTAPQQPEDK